jgi:XTP/dITP diphosphohydrolase
MEFLLASANIKKAKELLELTPKGLFSITPAPQARAVEENAKTFWQNALLKAQAYYKHFKRPALADDSGLMVDALPEELGVQTARFGGEGLTDKQRYELLLQRLGDTPQAGRGASFVCVLCFYLSPDQIYFFEGRLNGEIAFKALGEQGFGYDPVFLPAHSPTTGASLAQLADWKNEHSHRAKAMQHAVRFLSQHPAIRQTTTVTPA